MTEIASHLPPAFFSPTAIAAGLYFRLEKPSFPATPFPPPSRLMSIPAAEPQSDDSEAARASALAERIAAGDREAEAALITTYSRGLLFFLQRQGRTRDEADDLHQETFRIVIERLRGSGLDDPAALGSFLRGVALQLSRGNWRKQQRRKTDTDEDAIALQADAAKGALPELLDKERARLVRQTIEELPVERDRQLLYRFYVAEESRETICGELDLNVGHFHRVLFRARQRFKELYEKSAAGTGDPRGGPS